MTHHSVAAATMMRTLIIILAVGTAVQAFQTPSFSKLPRLRSQNNLDSSFRRKSNTSFSSPSSSSSSLGMAVLYPVSGVDSLPVLQQQLVFGGIYLGLGAGTIGLRTGFNVVENLLPDGWFAKWKTTWPLLGVVYGLAGVAHFGVPDAFVGIFPPRGTWGLWYLPGSAEFHVAWTGVAEFLGGAGLAVGGLGSAFLATTDDDNAVAKPSWAVNLTKLSAGSLALLTLAVTPANIYMYSHGAIMVGAGPDAPIDLQFHAVRFAAQILLLGILSTIATSSPSSSEESNKLLN